MMETFNDVHRQLGRATVAVMCGALAFLSLSLGSALLGFRHAVISFNGVAAALGYVFGGMLAIFLLTSLVAAVIRYLKHRKVPTL